MLGDRRAVSEIVAGLVLLMIVSTLGILLYNVALSTTTYQTGVVQDEYRGSAQKIQERFKVISVWGNLGAVNLTILNYGEMPVTITDVYFNGTRIDIAELTGIDEEIGTDEIHNIWFNQSVSSGDLYVINVVSERGVSSEYVWEP